MNSFELHKKIVLSIFYLLIFAALSSPATSETTTPVTFSNIAQSEKRVLEDNPLRDEKILTLTGKDSLTSAIIENHSLIVGSKIVIASQQSLYAWLIDHIEVSAALSRLFGGTYSVSPGSVYEYHGDDGEGLSIDFYSAYRDSVTTIQVGSGTVKIFLVPVSGSFIDFIEYYNIDDTTMTAQSCMYIRVNNPVTRFVTRVLFAISDLEKTIMKKILTLDDTTFKIITTFMEDPHLYRMLQEPDTPAPKGASELAVKMRDTVVRESSSEKARELGQLIESARLQMR